MEYKFLGTKGEWHAVEFLGFWEITNAPFYESKRILSYDSDVFGDCSTETQAKANAHLCAAAPELLQACIEMIEYEDRGRAKGEPRISEKYYNQMKQAIHKALNLS